MTTQEFISKIIGYYGPYASDRPMVKEVVGQYLEKTYKPDELDTLLAETFKKISGQYRQPPDVAQLDQVRIGVISRVPDMPVALPPPDISDSERTNMGEKLHDLADHLKNR